MAVSEGDPTWLVRSKAPSISTFAIPSLHWPAFLADKAPKDAPNVLVVLYNDTGLAAWSPFGGRINMPTLQRLADNGLIYSQWHNRGDCGHVQAPISPYGTLGPGILSQVPCSDCGAGPSACALLESRVVPDATTCAGRRTRDP
jgi:hypothetical protein